MSRRRRALLLGGLAIVLGGLAASNVAGREAALSRRVGELVPVVVAREPIAAGARVRPRSLAVRRVPRRFAPKGAIATARVVAGLKANVYIAADTDLTYALIGDGSRPATGPAIRAGERVAQVVALAPAALVTRGSRVDVLVTSEPRAGEAGEAVLALEDVAVLDAAAAGGAAAPSGRDQATSGDRVAASLLVTLRQAVYLAAAQDFAHELRLLPRADGDRAHGRAGLRMSALPP